MRARINLALLLLLVTGASVCPGPARAQTASSQSEYVLGPADVIDVTVVNHNELDKTLTILPDGRIAFPQVGEIMASGKTPKELAALIQKELEKTRNNVVVFITVKELRPRKVRVIGAIRTPGSYDVKKGSDHLLDIVAAAGGLSSKPARTIGRIIRGGSEVIALDIPEAILKPDSAANVLLAVDDLILLDETMALSQVHILGQVAKPGVFDLDSDTTVLSLLAAAGNATDKAALSKAYVLRKGTSKLPLDIRALVVEGRQSDEVMSFKFQNGDVLFIPENELKYSVMGNIARPGSYPIPERAPITVLDAMNIAGAGASGGAGGDNSDLSKVEIIRIVNGKPTTKTVDVNRMLKNGDLAANMAIQADDIIYVPARGSKYKGLEVFGLLSPLAYLGMSLFGR